MTKLKYLWILSLILLSCTRDTPENSTRGKEETNKSKEVESPRNFDTEECNYGGMVYLVVSKRIGQSISI